MSQSHLTSAQLREAFEEIALPIDAATVLHLTTLPAFTSRTLLVVVPSVYLLVKPATAILDKLKPNPDEVDAIFHAPLLSFLGLSSPTPDTLAFEHTFEDLIWLSDRLYRLHSFAHPSLPSAVTGLTADILVACALLATGSTEEQLESHEQEQVQSQEAVTLRTGYQRHAQGQMSWREIIRVALGLQGQQGLKGRGRTAA